MFPSIPYINNQPPHQANFSYSSSSQSLQNNQVATTVDTTFKSNFDIVLQSASIVVSLQSLDTMHTSLLIVDNNTAHSPNTTNLSSSYTSSFSLSPS